jgi:tetratricopeptide (TPR) repeat protein/DNA-binding CsgD family transcriptional regulator
MLLFLLPGVAAHAQDMGKVDSLKNIVEASRDDSVKVYLTVAISKEYVKKDVIVSLDYGEKALDIAENSNNLNLISYALFNMGVNYFQLGIMEQSIKYFFDYLEISKVLKNEKAIAYTLVNIGAIYLNINEIDKATKYFNQALAKFEFIYADSVKPVKETISIYNNLGVIAKRQHNTELAINYYNRGISLARRTPGYETELGNLLNNLGNIYQDMGNPEEAFRYFTEAFGIRLNHEDRAGLIKSYISLAKHYSIQNDIDKSLSLLYNALDLSGRVGSISLLAEVQRMIYDTYLLRQMADSALKYHILYTDLEDTLNQKAAMKEIKQLEINAHFREKERYAQIEMKQKEARYFLIGLSMLLTIILLTLLFFLARSKSRRLNLEKENILLSAKNVELEKANLEAELEIQHKKLTTSGIYQIQKNEIIDSIIKKLEKFDSSEAGMQQIDRLSDVINELNAAKDQAAWNEFELRFQQVHNDFFRKLNELNPNLSPNERRLCAFLKLNMTTKEISSITGQSYRSIEVARTRMRKKFNLTNAETGLIEFLSNI